MLCIIGCHDSYNTLLCIANKDVAGSSNTAGKSKMKRGLSKIFGGTLKFHKNLKGGLYLALLMYTDDEKILVTFDDYLPVVEVTESFNSQTIKQDFLWLSKVRRRIPNTGFSKVNKNYCPFRWHAHGKM